MSFNSIRPIALSLTSPLWIYRKEAPNNSFLDASLLLRCFLDACHSFDYAVEVNSRLSTITNTSQISLGGREKHFFLGGAPPSHPRSYVPGLPMKRGAEDRPEACVITCFMFKCAQLTNYNYAYLKLYYAIVVIIIHSLYPVFQFCRFVWSYGYNLPTGSLRP